MSLEMCVLSFFLYSFIGWFYESTICSLGKHKRLINRGFLKGPYCPVYGFGATLCYLLFGTIENAIILFFVAALFCSVLEYVTGYGMEQLFHAKWWDYSQYPFNLHGRICLYGAVIFGAGNVVICHKIQPWLVEIVSEVPTKILIGLAAVFSLLFVIDIITTLCNWNDFYAHLKGIQEVFVEKANQKYEDISELYQDKIQPRIVANRKGLDIWISGKKTRFKKSELRFLYAFPKLKMKTQEATMSKLGLRDNIKKVFGKWF